MIVGDEDTSVGGNQHIRWAGSAAGRRSTRPIPEAFDTVHRPGRGASMREREPWVRAKDRTFSIRLAEPGSSAACKSQIDKAARRVHGRGELDLEYASMQLFLTIVSPWGIRLGRSVQRE